MQPTSTAALVSNIPIAGQKKPGQTGLIENWPEYEAGLARRGEVGQLFRWLFYYLNEQEKSRPTSRTRREGKDLGGRPRVYKDALIRFVLVTQVFTGKALRPTIKFCEEQSLLHGLNDIEWPDHSTVSRRARQLKEDGLLRNKVDKKKTPVQLDFFRDRLTGWHPDVAIDSTGLSVRSPGLHRLSRRASGETLSNFTNLLKKAPNQKGGQRGGEVTLTPIVFFEEVSPPSKRSYKCQRLIYILIPPPQCVNGRPSNPPSHRGF